MADLDIRAPIQDGLELLYEELGKRIAARGEVARRDIHESCKQPPCDWCHDIGRIAQSIKALSELRVW